MVTKEDKNFEDIKEQILKNIKKENSDNLFRANVEFSNSINHYGKNNCAFAENLPKILRVQQVASNFLSERRLRSVYFYHSCINYKNSKLDLLVFWVFRIKN